MNTQQHPHPDLLAAYANGLADAADIPLLEAHVSECKSCCRTIAGLPADSLAILASDAVDTLGPVIDTDSEGRPSASPSSTCAEGVVPPPELLRHERYQIVRLIGMGGMGAVYLAEHRLMKRQVAIKIVHTHLLQNSTAVSRFQQEVEAAARLSHPNVVTAYDAEKEGDFHFLVTEFVDGTTLDQFVAQHGSLSVSQACDFVVQVAAGLQHAHEHGMVHRDIKPQNLIVTADGTVRILDFGLARIAREHPSGGRQSTQDHTVLGTPDFIAPEQAKDARSVDARSDIYSLGCTLYFLLAGRVPFPTTSSMLKISSHLLAEPKSVSALRPDIPGALTAIVKKMMARDPAERFQSADDVRNALQPFVDSDRQRQDSVDSHSSQHLTSGEARPATAWRRTGLFAGLIISLMCIWGVLNSGQEAADSSEETSPAAANIDDVYVAFLLAPDELWYEDFGPVCERLREHGVKVTVASSRPEITVASGSGSDVSTIAVDRQIHEPGPWMFDVIILCGGGVDSFCDESPEAVQVQRILRGHLDNRMFVGAICGGQQILAHGGFLEGVECAKPALADEWAADSGAIWSDRESVVKSGQFITASDPDDAEEFAMELLRLLGRR